jgi:hypothetical protein
MDGALQTTIAALRDQIGAAAIPEAGRHTAAWCVGQLPGLYLKYCQTSESRYAAEITRLLRGVLAEVAKSEAGSTGAQTAAIIDSFRVLHERLGLPALGLKLPPAPKPRSRKAG